MKYKVGDIVKLRDDLEVDKQYDGITFTNYKNEFKNESIKVIQISEADNTYRVIDEDNNAIWISEEMIEGYRANKLKLIDILNKIANGELKEGIKIRGGKFEFTCDTYFWANQVDFYKDLNTEVELIEPECISNVGKTSEATDNTKIEELDVDSFYDNIKGYETLDFEGAVLGISDKLNEVIRYIKKEQ